MAKKGRKGKYETHVKPYFKEIQQWCTTMTENQIAEKLGVGASTFAYYKTVYPELSEILKKGRTDLVTELRSALIKKAKGYQYTETKTVTEHTHLPIAMFDALIDAGFTPAQIQQAQVVKTEIAHKEMSPDVAALNLALKNYDKDNWANDPQMLKIRKEELKLRERQIEANEW